MAIRNNSQNIGKTTVAIMEITLYLNRRVEGLHRIKKQGWIHGYPGRIEVSRGRIWGHFIIWAGAVRSKTAKTKKK